ncbi:MAG TPA: dihydrofolate reductase [Paludibacteraceae bacterium]|jgi:dihydrofolate reductase|nr:dihydrofolate reductase [Paludibacteraceae bacterium]HOU68950.1 dihydrofolate reductase [Paludibacteraceae bacterium]HQF50741.1 dihydrofolate reductase [Paludibacteraceae bacterium]HQJ91186.1 dihydrofolate reductase [Paludibacteraceae bacterium]
MTLSIIVAIADNYAIGKDNQLMWHLSADMKHFKSITTGHAILMGRNTYDSIGRPLPNRRNIILSRTLAKDSVPGCEVIRDFSELEADETLQNEEVFVIGGGAVYRDLFSKADKLYITRVHTDKEGDVYFPEIDEKEWLQLSFESHQADEKNDYDYDFVDYERRK